MTQHQDDPNWAEVLKRIQKALSLNELTLEEAEQQMSELEQEIAEGKIEIQPMSEEDMERFRKFVAKGRFEPEPDYSWTDEYYSEQVAQDIYALNRKKGKKKDPETDRLIDELRQKALRDVEENEENEEEK